MFTFLKNYVRAQIFSFVVQLTVLSGSFGNLKIAIAERQNQVIFSAENLAGNVSYWRYFSGVCETNYSNLIVDTNFN